MRATPAQTVHPVWMASIPTHANVQRDSLDGIVKQVGEAQIEQHDL